jgi:hypothetical protein
MASVVVTGPEKDTKLGDVVVVSVPNKGPYGMQLGPDSSGTGIILRGWVRLPDGKFSALQKHGGIHIGDAVVRVNQSMLMYLKHPEAVSMMNDGNILRKTISFMNSNEYYRVKAETLAGQGKGVSMASGRVVGEKAEAPLMSFVSRLRVRGDGSDRVVEYEIANQFRLASMRLHKNSVCKWTVWKRYSEFADLHQTLVTSLGWQMDSVELPPSYHTTWDKFSETFVQRRKVELDAYWAKIIAIPRVTEFSKHSCSKELKSFLDVDAATRAHDSAMSEDGPDGDTFPVAPVQASRRASVGKQASLRRASMGRTLGAAASMAVQGGSSASSSSPPSSSSSSSALFPPPSMPMVSKFPKYDKMKSMLPAGAVRQKMTIDGISDADITAYLGEDEDGAAFVIATAPASIPNRRASMGPGAIPPPPPPPPPPAFTQNSVFSADSRFSKFDKMRRILPEGPVRQKMMIECIFTDAEIDAYMATPIY